MSAKKTSTAPKAKKGLGAKGAKLEETNKNGSAKAPKAAKAKAPWDPPRHMNR